MNISNTDVSRAKIAFTNFRHFIRSPGDLLLHFGGGHLEGEDLKHLQELLGGGTLERLDQH